LPHFLNERFKRLRK